MTIQAHTDASTILTNYILVLVLKKFWKGL